MNYEDLETGEILAEKGEDMTSIGDHRLVKKNHPRIVLRGQLDYLHAKLLLFMADCKEKKEDTLLEDLKELSHWVSLLQRHEVTEEPMPEPNFLGLSLEEIQKHSHDPKKYYGVPHLFGLSYTADPRVLHLNEIKAKARQVELIALNACEAKTAPLPKDIQKSLNRISSGIYLLELRLTAGTYDN